VGYRDDNIDLTDIGLGDGLATYAGDLLRHIAADDAWCVWDGKRWRLDDTLARQEVVKAYAETLDAAVDTIEDSKARGAAMRAVAKARSVGGMRAILASAASTPTMATRREEWDADPYLLHTASGVVDLRNGSVRPATPADMMLRSTKCAVGKGKPLRWLQFLDEIACGDKELIAYLRACVGMTLFGDQRDHVALLCIGIGANGKSTFLDILSAVMGELGRVSMPDLITHKRNDPHPTEIAALFGARLVVCTEAKDGAIDANKVKRLTGGGETTARGIGKDPRTETLRMTLWIDGNAEPRVYDTDEGIWRRLRKVPFRAHYPDGDPRRDPQLKDKLRAELPQITRWAIDACVDYLRDGLPDCAVVREATRTYRQDQDVLAEWIEACCKVDPGVSVQSGVLWASARDYLEEAGIARGWSQRRLSSELVKRGICELRKGAGGRRELRGITLQQAATQPVSRRTEWYQ
jgi:putative DNA primase/helicase